MPHPRNTRQNNRNDKKLPLQNYSMSVYTHRRTLPDLKTGTLPRHMKWLSGRAALALDMKRVLVADCHGGGWWLRLWSARLWLWPSWDFSESVEVCSNYALTRERKRCTTWRSSRVDILWITHSLYTSTCASYNNTLVRVYRNRTLSWLHAELYTTALMNYK